MRVLFSCNPMVGHLYPMIELAATLRESRHEVAVLSAPALATEIEKAGLDHVAAGPSFDTIVAEALTRYPDTSFDTPEDQQRFGFERLFSEIRVELALPDSLTAVAAFAPDLIVNEVADFVGPLVAASRSVPNVTAGIGLVVLDQWLDLAAAAVARFWEDAGLTARPDGGIYRCMYLNQLPSSLQRPVVRDLPMVHDLRPVPVGTGAALPDDLAHLGTERPMVYVSFGTEFNDPAVVNVVVDGLREIDVDVLVTVGPGGDPEAITGDRGRLEVRRFVPQGAVLDRCSLAVAHGGVGTTVGALSFGVPLVLIPMGADQAENAEQVVTTGAGRTIERAELDPGRVTTVVTEVLAADEMRAAAARVRDEIAAMPPPSALIGVLEALAASRD